MPSPTFARVEIGTRAHLRWKPSISFATERGFANLSWAPVSVGVDASDPEELIEDGLDSLLGKHHRPTTEISR